MLLVWTPGPANNLNRPTPTPLLRRRHLLLKAARPSPTITTSSKIKNDPNYNELQPKAVVPYSAIYGIPQPAAFPYLPNDGSARRCCRGHAVRTDRDLELLQSQHHSGLRQQPLQRARLVQHVGERRESQLVGQGADAGNIHQRRHLRRAHPGHGGVANRSYPNGGDPAFRTSPTERLRILGEIPLRKTGGRQLPMLDAQGNPDTSFLAKMPADTPFSFQTLDKNGLVLNMAQTWHMVRPGEVRNDCGGCHAHNKLPVDFNGTAAALASYQVADLTAQTPLLTKDATGNTTVKPAGRLVVDVEYYKDIKPILQRSCVPCHSKSGHARRGPGARRHHAGQRLRQDLNRLAERRQCAVGHPAGDRQPAVAADERLALRAHVPVAPQPAGVEGIRTAARRLDATPTIPPNRRRAIAATLPAGANPDNADIDYTGTIMPPPELRRAAVERGREDDDRALDRSRRADHGARRSDL